MTSFFRRWGVAIRISSAHYPQSNGRTEAAVKTAKRIIRDNTGPGGTLDCDRMSLALLQYLNTPLRNINRSPAQLATGRQLRDGVPTARQHLKVDRHWQYTLRERERKLAEAHNDIAAEKTCRNLTPLEPGTPVRAQNPVTKLWDRTGSIVETLPHRQYTVRLDGSGRITLRNRKHLCPNLAQQPVSTPVGTHTPMVSRTPAMEGRPPTPLPSCPRRVGNKPRWLSDYVDFSP